MMNYYPGSQGTSRWLNWQPPDEKQAREMQSRIRQQHKDYLCSRVKSAERAGRVEEATAWLAELTVIERYERLRDALRLCIRDDIAERFRDSR
jgi:hypothetical protein